MEAGFLPPPAARPGPKSNADFRALLDTPRPPRGDDDRKPSSAAASSDKKKRKPFKPKQEEAKEEEDDGPKYRCSRSSPPPPFLLCLPPCLDQVRIVCNLTTLRAAGTEQRSGERWKTQTWVELTSIRQCQRSQT